MSLENNSISQPLKFSLKQRMLMGAGIGLILISLFVFPGESDPDWGKLWMIRPLIVVTLAGAMGGLCNYFIIKFHKKIGVNKVLAALISAIIFIIGIWMGIVLGLDGTLWD